MNRIVSWVNQRAGAIIVAIALASGTLYAVQVYDERAKASCQARFNEAFAEQLTVRSRVTRSLLEGMGDAFVQKPSKDPKVQAARLAAFLMLFSEYKKEIAHPLPAIPNC
jgi:hypothetical protein